MVVMDIEKTNRRAIEIIFRRTAEGKMSDKELCDALVLDVVHFLLRYYNDSVPKR